MDIPQCASDLEVALAKVANGTYMAAALAGLIQKVEDKTKKVRNNPELGKHLGDLIIRAKEQQKAGQQRAAKDIAKAVPSSASDKAAKGHSLRPGTAVRDLKNKQTPSPSGLDGASFLNPYSFLPFTKTGLPVAAPTPRTRDEVEGDRFTGIIECSFTTVTPLLISDPVPVSIEQGTKHKTYRIQAIGPDVVVPATGVRGALRSLLEALCGASVGVHAEHIWLREGRHPNGSMPSADTPGNAHLVRVKQARPGQPVQLELGLTVADLPPDVSWTKKGMNGPAISKTHHPGFFKPLGLMATLPSDFLDELIGLNYGGELDDKARHQDEYLKKDDLCWLILKRNLRSSLADMATLKKELDSALDRDEEHPVLSLSYTRWARRGSPMWRRMPTHAHPACWSVGGNVDPIADLFGLVPMHDALEAGVLKSFAGRIRPENLVFEDVRQATQNAPNVTLAPLMPPHPSCRGFYRHANDPEGVSSSDTYFDQNGAEQNTPGKRVDPLRGYKVYRVPSSGDKPWLYATQPVPGQERDPKLAVNRTVQLLEPNNLGKIRFAVRSLSPVECGLLLAVLAKGVPWRLGGGKSLGLGACVVAGSPTIRDDLGQPITADRLTAWATAFEQSPFVQQFHFQERLALWRKSQARDHKLNLRYPRAKNNGQQGGHIWFSKLAAEQKNKPYGMQPYNGQPGQLLPHLQDDNQANFGYDGKVS